MILTQIQLVIFLHMIITFIVLFNIFILLFLYDNDVNIAIIKHVNKENMKKLFSKKFIIKKIIDFEFLFNFLFSSKV